MNSRDATMIQSDIRAILLHDWDPVGVQDEPGAQDEYDSYVGGVYRLLAECNSVEALAKHLLRIEADQMGLTGASLEQLLPVARQLCALNVALGSAS